MKTSHRPTTLHEKFVVVHVKCEIQCSKMQRNFTVFVQQTNASDEQSAPAVHLVNAFYEPDLFHSLCLQCASAMK